MNTKDEIKNFFREDGLLSSHIENYELRNGQIEMSLKIFETLKSQKHIFIEAPTGIGKSFAYLIPAIYYAKENNKKAIISTHTINLQEQLIEKDIPLLKKILPIEFKASLLKGRSNYVCPMRLAKAMTNSYSLFDDEERSILDKIYQWSLKTPDGTLSDIHFKIPPAVWANVCSEMGICTHKTCGGENTKCFYHSAKKELADSDVIIVNHHLFFTLYDGIGEGQEDVEGYLYHNDFIIFDEAHTVEQVAAEHIAPHVTREMIRFHLMRLYNPNKKTGVLTSLPAMHIFPTVTNLLDLNNHFFHRIRLKLTEHQRDYQKLTYRIYEKHLEENIMEDELENLVKTLRMLVPVCKDENQANEVLEFINKFNAFKNTINEFLEQRSNTKGKGYVYWVEFANRRPDSNITLSSSSIDLSDYFRKNIFRENNSTIFTSATLTINNNFTYFKKRLGAESVDELKLDSPFDYERQVKIFIPKKLESTGNKITPEYENNLKDWIEHFIDMTNGKALVLFTNFSLLKKTSESMKFPLAEKNINLFIQGDGTPRTKLLQQFKADTHSVLFGLDSFWMGVDVPGESLSNLIITKLPFQVPDHPVVEARMEFIESRGGNSFMEYSLPEAILKFRQGFGRLIRNKNDEGIVAILDSRIINKPYGKYFLNSIEQCEINIV
ncbi:MAG: DEAD/DEAH box helicase [Ignavibacteria bacterium]|nr:DEAD/DEAH box helicase [Ignavibacteria bacterium]